MFNKTFHKIAAILLTAAITLTLANCGNDSGSDDNVPVSISFNIPAPKMKASAPSPAVVTSIVITITGADMATMTDTFNVSAGTTVTKIYAVPPGTERTFTAYAYDRASGTGFLLYQGSSIEDLTAGVTANVLITMAVAPYAGKYVDINRGVDNASAGSPISPYRTITYALGQSGGNEPINVAAGFYNMTANEFLYLKPGNALKCVGPGHTTVIDYIGTYLNPAAIIGANGASIDGCKITNAGSSAIFDNGSTTISNNLMLENCNGIISFGNSIITGNTFHSSIAGGDCYSGAINTQGSFAPNTPIITGNTITNNWYGIVVGNSAPVINNNTISCNSAADLDNSASTIDATNNRWDHVPPNVNPSTCTGSGGEDICGAGGNLVNYAGASLASSPCP